MCLLVSLTSFHGNSSPLGKEALLLPANGGAGVESGLRAGSADTWDFALSSLKSLNVSSATLSSACVPAAQFQAVCSFAWVNAGKYVIFHNAFSSCFGEAGCHPWSFAL